MHASPPVREGRRSFACISSGIATVIQVPGGAIKGTITDLMSHSQFHCTGRVYLDLHGLIFETSICYWQDQPGSPQEGVWDGQPQRACFLHAGLAPRRVSTPPGGGGTQAARPLIGRRAATSPARGSRGWLAADRGRNREKCASRGREEDGRGPDGADLPPRASSPTAGGGHLR